MRQLQAADSNGLDLSARQQRIAELYRSVLLEIGEDPGREGLKDTPDRVARWWLETLSPEPDLDRGRFIEAGARGQKVTLQGIEVWSLCEHHLLPFSMVISVTYIAEDRILGLSKFARLARHCARGLQVQERFTAEYLESVQRQTGSSSVLVSVLGTHLCMSMRGVRMQRTTTTTEAGSGVFERYVQESYSDGPL